MNRSLTPEHLATLIGQFPRKPAYRVAFWAMVVLHGTALTAWLWTRG